MTAHPPLPADRAQDARIADRSEAFPFRVGDRVGISGYAARLYARPQHWRSLVGTVTEASRQPYHVSVRRDTQMGVRRWHVNNLKLLAVLTEAKT